MTCNFRFVQTLPQLEKEVEELEKKYKAFTSVDVLEEKIKNLKNELAWSFVQENEKVNYPKFYLTIVLIMFVNC